jgi:hypothetical protein
MKLILLLLLLVPFASLVYAENSHEYTEAKLEWSQHNFGIINGTGTAKIILTDFDAPNISSYIDRVTVFVYSDSFPEGIDLTLYETGKNSGIFERIFSLSDTRFAPSVLYAVEGDTAIVEYFDDTLPLDHEFSEVHLRETTLIGLLGYPTERLPVSNARIVNLDGNRLDFPIIGEQILLISDIVSGEDTLQEFIWIAQTVDSQNRIESLSWIDGTINPHSSFSPSTSWIPQNAGDYRTTFFVWESIDNPTALSPPVELEFTVLKERPVPIPEKEITITIGDPVNKKGLLPIITTEKTSNIQLLDFVTDWNFLPLNHGEWGPQGERVSWDTLPSKNRVHNFTGEKNGESIEIDQNLIRESSLSIYDANCQGEQIEMLSAALMLISIPKDTSSTSFTISSAGLLPVDGLYTLQFASFFDQEIMLPENAVIVSSEEKRCAVNHEKYSSGEYINIIFKLESFPDDFDFQYSFGIGEKNSYDSKTELYGTDMVCDDSIITPVPLTEIEKTMIWESISKNNFFQMGDFTDNCDDAGNCILMEPEDAITLFVDGDGIKHSVSYRESYIGKNGKLFSNFNNIIDTLNEIFEDKKELEFLPKPRCGYM